MLQHNVLGLYPTPASIDLFGYGKFQALGRTLLNLTMVDLTGCRQTLLHPWDLS